MSADQDGRFSSRGGDRNPRPEGEDELEYLLGGYIDRLTAGETLDSEEILAEHPEAGEEILKHLREFAEIGSIPGGTADLGSLGDYVLRREVGRGGMGVVYEAWQRSMDRRVALKVLPPGVAADDKSYSRFMREARTAGKLNHPHVVPVYAMGVDQNTPYYAMELVEGETLAAILQKLRAAEGREAEKQGILRSLARLLGKGPPAANAEESPAAPASKPPDEARAAAAIAPESTAEPSDASPAYFAALAASFAGAADGLQHAHSRGIIHRDIKPSNIIVDSREGRLRILDFGLAHLEGQESFTASGELVGTPLYMSPEQARARRIPIDHRTDIYSLGATLYEMLTLSPPFRGKDHQDTVSQILTREPRHPRQLDPEVPRDLETIVLKCLRKEAADRYGTAEALAQDLRRFVRGDPIEARPQPAWERWSRSLWRHGVALGVAALFLALLGGGLALGGFLIWREQLRTEAALREARARQEEADLNFGHAREAVDQMLTEVGESALAEVPGMEETRRSLLERALTFYERFLSQRGGDAEVRLEAGRAHLRMGDIHQMLGRHADGEKAYREAARLLGELARAHPEQPEHSYRLGRARLSLGKVLAETGRRDEARMSFEEARAVLENLTADFPGELSYRVDLASTLHQLGELFWQEMDRNEAERRYRRAVELEDSLVTKVPASGAYRKALSSTLCSLGQLLYDTGDTEAAEKSYRSALSLYENVEKEAGAKPDDLNQLAKIRFRIAVFLGGAERRAEAETETREALRVSRKLAEDFPHVPEYRKTMARCCLRLADLFAVEKPVEIEKLYGEALGILRELASDFPTVSDYRETLAEALNDYASWLDKYDRHDPAQAAFAEAIAITKQLAAEHPDLPDHANRLAMFSSNLGGILWQEGKLAEAAQEFGQALAGLRELRAQYPSVHEYAANVARIGNNLGLVLKDLGQLEGAQEAFREATAIQEDLTGRFPENSTYRDILARNLFNLADVLVKAGRMDEAETCFRRCISIQRDLVRKDPEKTESRRALGGFLTNAGFAWLRDGRFAAAAEALRESLDHKRFLVDQEPENPRHRFDLAVSHFHLAAAAWHLGEEKEARQSYDTAMGLAKQMEEEGPGLQRLREKTEALLRGAPDPQGSQ